MTLSTQRKLLRVLQSGEFQRVGGSKDIEVDVRVIAATNKNLPKEVDAGKFREDLFYRLNVITIALPPLRDRISDIPQLVAYFLDRFRYRQGMPPLRIVDEAMDIIQHHSWPGNVRELENAIHRAVILSGGNAITPEHLDLSNARSPYTLDLTEAVRDGRTLASVMAEVHREMIRLAMLETTLDEAEAASLLGVILANNASVVVGFCILRLEADGFAVILDRAVVVAFVLANNAPVVVGFCILRLEADGFAVILDRAVVVALIVAGNAPVHVSFRKLRLEADRAVVILDRAVVVAFVLA